MSWPEDHELIEKHCEVCGNPMWCTHERKKCSTCRREADRLDKIRRRREKKMADRLATEKDEALHPFRCLT